MIGRLGRGAYVVVVGAMIVAWVVSLGKEIPVEPQEAPQIWVLYT